MKTTERFNAHFNNVYELRDGLITVQRVPKTASGAVHGKKEVLNIPVDNVKSVIFGSIGIVSYKVSFNLKNGSTQKVEIKKDGKISEEFIKTFGGKVSVTKEAENKIKNSLTTIGLGLIVFAVVYLLQNFVFKMILENPHEDGVETILNGIVIVLAIIGAIPTLMGIYNLTQEAPGEMVLADDLSWTAK